MPKEKSQKINGIEYVYYDKPVWNAEKKYGTHKREYIGKRVDGQFIPNKSRQLQQELEQERKKKRGPVPSVSCSRLFYGATYLFDSINARHYRRLKAVLSGPVPTDSFHSLFLHS